MLYKENYLRILFKNVSFVNFYLLENFFVSKKLLSHEIVIAVKIVYSFHTFISRQPFKTKNNLN